MSAKKNDPVEQLIRKGVDIPAPESVFVGEEVALDRISGQGVVIHPGCRIRGPKTLILSDVRLGEEAPVTLEDCRLGRQVTLKGGFFRQSCLLDGVTMGSAAQVREGCLLEEQAGGGHAVGLKQTILFPYVTLGSLINFCDCFMAGGRSRKDHSEVGSSYIHFNYTPNQDKATPSLVGDVPKGVMLDQPPIFLGGQGGMVGPVQIAFGTVVGAGVICRSDVFEEGKLVLTQGAVDRKDRPVRRLMDFSPGVYCQIRRKVLNNVAYVAQVIALAHWYRHVRTIFFQDGVERGLFEGVMEILDMALQERLARFRAFAERMPRSIRRYREVVGEEMATELFAQKDEFSRKWPELETLFSESRKDSGDRSRWEPFVREIEVRAKRADYDYLQVIHGLDVNWRSVGTTWLQSIVDGITNRVIELMPSMA